jgi:L-seryl-tRNA(Ser) seleniumtransferase
MVMDEKHRLLRALPKVDECLALLHERGHSHPLGVVKHVVQTVIDEEREKILAGRGLPGNRTLEQWAEVFVSRFRERMTSNFRRVINGTGVVIHTNLGRSILASHTTEVLEQAGGYYSNLEFDLKTGKRGSRYSLVEELLCFLTGAEAALVVNNNAAAVLICLDTLTRGKEAIVSRGQLVEIGGSFRIPDVMAKSGARLVEVGATNRTHVYDYEKAITPETALLLRVHTSNFRMVGFTSEVSPEEMVTLARNHQLVTMEDLGSGSLIDFSPYGFPKEPTVQEIVKAGIDVVTFSGDKLLGGPQAGIIVGRKEMVTAIKKNPLNRALRIDKFTLAALESVLRDYLDIDKALTRVPTLAMLTVSPDELKKRARRLLARLRRDLKGKCDVTMMATVSRVGGGALPEFNIQSWAIVLAPLYMSINTMEQGLRALSLPVIGRIEKDRFLLDVRTLQEREFSAMVRLLSDFFVGEKQ